MIRKILGMFATLALMFSALPASAAVQVGGVSGIFAINAADPGLVVNGQATGPSNPFILNFANVGDSFVVDIGDFWTNETDVGADDLLPKLITGFIGLEFIGDTGSTSWQFDGTTYGVNNFFTQHGVVDWGGQSQVLSSVNGLNKVRIDLINSNFNAGFFGLQPGQAFGGDWNARITLTAQEGGAVPEPASWAMMIAGFGLVGANMRRRRTTNSKAVVTA